MTRKRITHFIVGLGLGGAETMLYQVMKYGDRECFEHTVLSFGASHYYEEPIRRLGISVEEVALYKRPLYSLVCLMRAARQADVLCCWMYHANLLGLFAGKLTGTPRIVWNIRHSSLDKETNSRRTLRINRICARLSTFVDSIAYNGERARKAHESIGYRKDRGIILTNGCDCERFRPDAHCRDAVFLENRIPHRSKLVLSITRDHPIKDVPNFLRAFGYLNDRYPHVVAVICGSGITENNDTLISLCNECGLTVGRDVHLLGLRDDIERLMAACDLYVLHSAGEAFPNVLIQAMACGCLCIATDVGDVRQVLANDEQVVAPRDSVALYEKMVELLALGSKETERLRLRARERAVQEYSIERVVQSYEQLY